MKSYFVLEKETGDNRQIAPDKVDAFFRAVESVTGLDRAIAAPILNGGNPIEHPLYRFTARDVNPFLPVKIPIP
jgi:hypothetical protein